MTDIIDALEAKPSRLAATLALGAAMIAAPALAQDPQRWTDPTGAWSMDFLSSGWGYADGLPPGGPVLLIAPAQAPSNDAVRVCFVEETAEQAGASEGGAEIRARAAHVGPADASAYFSRAQLRNVAVGHAEIDGVAVASIEGASQGNRFRGRVFFTSHQGRAVRSTLACISRPGMAPALDGEIDNILGSLHFGDGNE